MRERIEEIVSNVSKKEKVCILTDFDKNGKKLYLYIKPILKELGVKIDSSFRGLLLKSRISHIEEISNFLNKVEKI